VSEHPTAIFADQVEPGMRISADPVIARATDWKEAVNITQVRVTGHLVTLLGTYDDGSPFINQVGLGSVVLMHTTPERVADDLSSL
jgi:hypothetical protein